ncbi:hypothetical protein [Merismopedia glauca]|uniref:Tetratricopeptide repeat protein n=1 Tax=Merismopedia glauca CCAP 1448/3 TaxID=1296344 RepID=A0A2T1C828_9CYAN|nr:hypothetical protein [Merismopedia glauca]PSB04432.1 hypothetical protein C7B64_03840 [Merismopedia glauca CCAP 1448/3]
MPQNIPLAIPPHQRQPLKAWKIILSIVSAGVVYLAIEYFITPEEYHKGERAYKAGNCPEAIAYLARFLNEWKLPNINVNRAQNQGTECRDFLAIAKLQPGDAVGAYMDLLSNNPSSPLREQIRQRLTNLLPQTNPSFLARPKACEKIDSLVKDKIIPQPETYAPLFYQACGQMYAAKSDYTLALKMYGGFLKNYPQHQLASQVKVEWAKSKIGWAKTAKYKQMGAPVLIGLNKDGSTTITVQNDSPQKIRLIATGTETRIEELPPCQKCSYYLTEPEKCPKPEDEPLREYRLPPGQYDILVEFRSDRGYRNLFLGGGFLETRGKYNIGCYFTIRQPQTDTQPEPEVEGADEWLTQ